jgi:hypothetical protein
MAILISPDGASEFVLLDNIPKVFASQKDLAAMRGVTRLALRIKDPPEKTNIGLSVAATLQVDERERAKVAPKLVQMNQMLSNLKEFEKALAGLNPAEPNEQSAKIVLDRIFPIIWKIFDNYAKQLSLGKSKVTLTELAGPFGIPPRLLDKMLSRKFDTKMSLYHIFYPKDWSKTPMVWTPLVNKALFKQNFKEILTASEILFAGLDSLAEDIKNVPSDDLSKLKIVMIPDVPLFEAHTSIRTRYDFGSPVISLTKITMFNKALVDACFLIIGNTTEYNSKKFAHDVLGVNQQQELSIPEIGDRLKKLPELTTRGLLSKYYKTVLTTYPFGLKDIDLSSMNVEQKHIDLPEPVKCDLVLKGPIEPTLIVEKKVKQFGLNPNAIKYPINKDATSLLKTLIDKQKRGEFDMQALSALKSFISSVESPGIQSAMANLFRGYLVDGIPIPSDRGGKKMSWAEADDDDRELDEIPDLEE